jgi:hypothetical protein
MSWQVNDQEFSAILRQEPEKQYRYLVGHCADRGEIWGLARDGTDWAMVETDDGQRLFAVWPHPRYAEAWLQRSWATREPTRIDVHEFTDGLIPRLIADGFGVAVFPLPDGRHIPVSPRQFRSDVEAELSRLE